MKYVVVSAVVTDEIHFPDGNVKIAPGGAGFYALCGLRLCLSPFFLLTLSSYWQVL